MPDQKHIRIEVGGVVLSIGADTRFHHVDRRSEMLGEDGSYLPPGTPTCCEIAIMEIGGDCKWRRDLLSEALGEEQHDDVAGRVSPKQLAKVLTYLAGRSE